MAYSQIANIIPQYEDYPNYWLKAYSQGTTTAKLMAIDSAGATTVAKLELNSLGFPITSGDALVIPYIDGAYDLWLFPLEAEADANDTSNAILVADNINPSPWEAESDFTENPTFDGNELYHIDNINEAVIAINNQIGTSYTPILSDRNGVITLNNAAAITVTIPDETAVAYPIGTSLSFAQLGAGQATITPDSGVTINAETGLNINSQYGFATILKIASDTWIASGSLVV